MGGALQQWGEAHGLGHLFGSKDGLAAAQPCEPCEELQVLRDGRPRVDPQFLRGEPDHPPDLPPMPPRIKTTDGDGPLVGSAEPNDDFHQRGLTGPVRAEEANDLSPGDVEVNTRYRRSVTVTLGHTLDGQDRVLARPRCARRCIRRRLVVDGDFPADTQTRQPLPPLLMTLFEVVSRRCAPQCLRGQRRPPGPRRFGRRP
jgi:hypothetical protein